MQKYVLQASIASPLILHSVLVHPTELTIFVAKIKINNKLNYKKPFSNYKQMRTHANNGIKVFNI